MVFHRSLSDSKSTQVSRTLLSILADLNNAVIWMASARPLISKSSNPCASPLVTVPSAPITTGLTVTSMLHSFFSSLARSRCLSLFSLPFSLLLSLLSLQYSLGVIHTHYSRCFFPGVWVTSSFFKSPVINVIYLDLTLILISNSSGLFSKPLGPVQVEPTAIGITVNSIFHNYYY